MRHMRSCRCVLSVSLFVVFIALAIVLSACGGSTNAANNSAPTAPTATPPAGGSGTPSGSGTGTGSGGSGSGGSGGTPTPSSSGNRYLYVGIAGNQGGVDGFKVDPATGCDDGSSGRSDSVRDSARRLLGSWTRSGGERIRLRRVWSAKFCRARNPSVRGRCRNWTVGKLHADRRRCARKTTTKYAVW